MAARAPCGRLAAMLVAQRYELGAPLGAGGEARVFRARDLTDGSEVALRLSTGAPGHLPAARATPTHPGWVRLLDEGTEGNNTAFTVFELLRGETLEQLVARQPLRPDAWLDFAGEALESVAALHAAGWTHGDLNAGNFLHHDGTTWKLLELPFGRAPRRGLFGSIYTLAPEQIDGSPPDPRSDVYALGCLCYHAAAGAYPHAGGSAAQIAVDRLRFEPAPLPARAPALPRGQALWVMHLLARDPAQRPADAAAARQLLAAAE